MPRNAVEIPLYVLTRWSVWPPLRVILGLPYRDVEERIRPTASRIVAVGQGLDGVVDVDPVAAARHEPDALVRAGRGVEVVIETSRPARRGPRRAPESMQLLPDLGLDQPAEALAWMLLWRDLAVVAGQLGTQCFAGRNPAWPRFARSKTTAIRKQRERLRALGGDLAPRWLDAGDEASGRNAVVAARGMARRCGVAADLVTSALSRYKVEPSLRAIELPARDLYRYHPDVRGFVPFFVQPGGELADYSGEVTHRVVRRPDDPTSSEVDL